MESVLALSSPEKIQRLSRRLRRPITAVGTTRALVRQMAQAAPALVILDVNFKLPRVSGADLLERVRQQAPDIPVLMLAIDDFAGVDMLSTLFSRGSSEQAAGANQSTRVHPELHDPESGRINARHVALFFGLSLSRLARIIRRSPQSVHKTSDAAGLQDALAVFVRIASALLVIFSSADQARIWLNAPHPDLDNMRPIQLIERRKGDIVAELLEDAMVGHPG